ncbi:MAG: family 16 glycosylhydrolase [Anaerolineaceae bacterium]|nr:family 16 glycosylhydrolase [Anaerolineaceae bacterium]
MNRRRISGAVAAFGLLVAMVWMLGGQAAYAAAPLTIYGDNLTSGWANWSWSTTINFAATTPIHGGSSSLSAKYDAAWAGVYLRSNQAVGAGYDTLRFWINGGTGNQLISVSFYDANSNAVQAKSIQAVANTWTQVDISLAAFGPSSNLWGVVWQENTGNAQPVFYLDDIQLLTQGSTPQPPQSGLTLRVDAAAGRHAISPYIYGMNFADAALAADIKLPINRWGGNGTTRYNFKLDTSNHASDWYFENIPDDNSNPGALPNGSGADNFVAANKGRGTDTLMTVPLIGWTPKTRAYACGFSVAKYGAQQSVDPYRPDCGNGIKTNGTNITGNDPTDTSLAITPAFVQEWMNHLKGVFGVAGTGGVRFYNLDNEPMLWSETHRDVHPNPLSYDELRDRTYQYAAAIKANDPAAQTLGPVEWGWSGYFYSMLDMSAGGSWWNNPLDRNAHGGMELTAWYLDQMKKYEQTNGVRILDYLDLHYYPQSSGVSLSPAGSQATQDLRLRSTRSLWDSTYVDESWINDKIRMIPRMHDWVNTYYPGTKLAITEYNFGGLEHINGAMTQADVLGIFGREGLDLATMWDPPTAAQPAAYAFRMYRNYNGQGGMFGETAVQASSDDQSKLSVYAAQRADNALTIMVINKTTSAQTSTLNLANFNGAAAQVYTYSQANLSQIIRGTDVAISANNISTTYPAQSITLLVIPAGSAPTATPITPTITPTKTPTITPTLDLTPHISNMMPTLMVQPVQPNDALLTTPTPVPTNMPVLGPPGTGWTMVFNDEFDGGALDASKWNTCYQWALDYGFNYCRAGNDELQWYQPDDVSVQNGQLHLKAEKRSFQNANYTSGMVDSHGKFNFLYGYAEARFRVPKGKGLWPAFWMLPQDKSWPPEIDIMEILGDKPNLAYTTLHWGQENNSTGKVFNGPDFSADFHTFAVNWQKGLIVWYIDGVEVFRTTSNTPDKAMYVILNLAVGGSWPGSPDGNTVFPANFDVDYVRVWQQGQPTSPTTTLVQPTATVIPPTFTVVPPTATLIPATNTLVPTDTLAAPTATFTPELATVTEIAPTPEPTGATLAIEMSSPSAPSGSTVSATLKLFNMNGLYGMQVECQVDPTMLSGTSYKDGEIFTSANSFIVDAGYQSDGSWSVASSLLNPAPAFNGDGTAFSLNFKVLKAGQTNVACTVLAVDANGNQLPLTVVNGHIISTEGPVQPTRVPPIFTAIPATDVPLPTITPTLEPTLTPMPGAISGVVKYEKRDNQTGIAVTVLLVGTPFLQSQTNADGSFRFDNLPAGQYTVQFRAAGYLTSTTTVDVHEGQCVTVQVTLVAGDIDGNGMVDLTDAGFIGANYRVQVPPAPSVADLNADGVINLVDLVLVGKNFGKTSQ